MVTLKQLCHILSKLKGFSTSSWKLEQYMTEPDIAGEVLWNSALKDEVCDKSVIDLGCGTGILGIGALLLGAKKVIFVDIDEKALNICIENYKEILSKYDISEDVEFINLDILELEGLKGDIVFENPPFGAKNNPHIDRKFLLKAFKFSDIIYSFHKIESEKFVDSLSNDNGFSVRSMYKFRFPLKNTMHYHKKKVEKIDVGCFKIVKI